MNRKLTIDDEEILKQLYVRQNIPTDQYKSRPDALHLLTETFNDLTERSDDPDDLLHLMITRRKKGRWPRLGPNHKKLHPLPPDAFTEDEWRLMDSIYLDIGKGSDRYAYEADLRKELTRRFSASAGRVVPARILCAAIEDIFANTDHSGGRLQVLIDERIVSRAKTQRTPRETGFRPTPSLLCALGGLGAR